MAKPAKYRIDEIVLQPGYPPLYRVYEHSLLLGWYSVARLFTRYEHAVMYIAYQILPTNDSQSRTVKTFETREDADIAYKHLQHIRNVRSSKNQEGLSALFDEIEKQIDELERMKNPKYEFIKKTVTSRKRSRGRKKT